MRGEVRLGFLLYRSFGKGGGGGGGGGVWNMKGFKNWEKRLLK